MGDEETVGRVILVLLKTAKTSAAYTVASSEEIKTMTEYDKRYSEFEKACIDLDNYLKRTYGKK